MERGRHPDGDHPLKETLLRWRYLWLSIWATAWFTPAYLRSQSSNRESEWDVFVYGGRVLLGLHPPTHHFGALHLYGEYPGIQIGPPSLYLAGSLSWLTQPHSGLVAGVVMLAGGILSVRLVEQMSSASPLRLLCGGAVALPAWAIGFGYYRHLDDAIAVTLILLGMLLLMKGRHEFWAAVALGTAAASKPWAIIALPLLLSQPRSRWIRTVGIALIVASIWWLPFLAADRHTFRALSGFSIPIGRTSVLHLLGFRGMSPHWVRAAQFGLGAIVVGLLSARGRMPLALVAGIAIRLALDPATAAYYSASAVVATLAFDLVWKQALSWTLASVACLYVAKFAKVGALGLLLWAVLVAFESLRPATITHQETSVGGGRNGPPPTGTD